MAIVIGADQVAWSDDDPTEAWGKPRDRVDQVERLHSLVGRAHHVTTGLAVLGPSFRDEVVVRTTLWMRSDVTKAEIEAVRGVQVGPILRALVDRGLVKVAGRSDDPGHALLYGTTRKFLDTFGLADLADLPRDAELVRDS